MESASQLIAHNQPQLTIFLAPAEDYPLRIDKRTQGERGTSVRRDDSRNNGNMLI